MSSVAFWLTSKNLILLIFCWLCLLVKWCAVDLNEIDLENITLDAIETQLNIGEQI